MWPTIEATEYTLTQSLGREDKEVYLHRRSHLREPEHENLPGVAIINPDVSLAREIIAFSGLEIDGARLVLKDVVRGVYSTQPVAHPTGSTVSIDQGEQYGRLANDTPKQLLKRYLRRLLED
jgi:hypothetical protein